MENTTLDQPQERPAELNPVWKQWADGIQQQVNVHEAKLRTGLVSEKFWTRAFAVFGHTLAVQAIIFGAIFVVGMLFGILGAAATFSSY
jgi:hypothetical protein